MSFRVQFQISQIGAPLFSEGNFYVLMALYLESAARSHFRQQTGISSQLFAVIVKICFIAPLWIWRIKEVA